MGGVSAKARLRRFVDEHAPWLETGYRAISDRKMMATMLTSATPYDFTLTGGNSLAAGVSDPIEVATILPYIDSADAMIDVGANNGFYTCLASRRGKTVVAIEPLPANLRILYHNLEQNGLSGLVEIFPVAASDGPGVLPLYGRGQGASLKEGWGGVSRNPTLMVPTNSLDRLLAARFSGRNVFLKVDVEGAELRVLKGAESLLRSCSAILAEISISRNHEGTNPQFQETFEFLCGERGYVALGFTDRAVRVSADSVKEWVRAGQTSVTSENFLFVQDEGLIAV